MLSFKAYSQSASNYALSFDGVYDHALVPSFVEQFPNEGITFEAQIKLEQLEERYYTILSATYLDEEDNKMHFSFGVNGATFRLAVEVNNIVYEQENGNTLDTESCHWVAVTFVNDEIMFYINGQLESTINGVAPPIQRINEYMIGNALSSTNFEGFSGLIDETRGWLAPLNDNDLQNTMVPLQNPMYDMHLHVNFFQGQGQVIVNFWHPIPGYLGNSITIDSSDPTWVENACLEFESPIIERTGNELLDCPTDSKPCELVCNGGFEVYDSIHFSTLPYPYMFNALAPDPNFNSDVAGWYANRSNEFFFRGAPNFSPASNYGIPTNIITLLLGPMNSITVETRTGQAAGNNAYAGIATSMIPAVYNDHPRDLINKLKEPLIGHIFYDLDFWTFTYPVLSTSFNTAFKVYLQSGTDPTQRHLVGIYDQLNSAFVSTNNGWYNTNTSFQVPANGITYDHLVFQPSDVFENSVFAYLPHPFHNYTFIDDVSLTISNCCNVDFQPKLIEYAQSAGYCCSDLESAVVEDNYQGDIFTAVVASDADSIHVEDEPAYHLPTRGWSTTFQKYCADGSLSWTTLLDGLTVEDMATDFLGNAYVSGYYTETFTGTLSNSQPITLTHLGGKDAFIAKITSNGELEWITRIVAANGDINAKQIVFGNDLSTLYIGVQSSFGLNCDSYNSNGSGGLLGVPVANVTMFRYSSTGNYLSHLSLSDLNLSALKQAKNTTNYLYLYGTSSNPNLANVRIIDPISLTTLSSFPIIQSMHASSDRMNKSLVIDESGDCFISIAFGNNINFNGQMTLTYNSHSSCVALARLNRSGNQLTLGWAQSFHYPNSTSCFSSFIEEVKMPLGLKDNALYLGITENNECDYGNGVVFSNTHQSLVVKFNYNGDAQWLVESSGNPSDIVSLSSNGPFPGIYVLGDFPKPQVTFGNHTFNGFPYSDKSFLVRVKENAGAGAYLRQASNNGDSPQQQSNPNVSPFLYPNPANESLFFNSHSADLLNFKLFDLSGRVVLEGIYQPDAGIDVRSIVPGMYVVRFEGHKPIRFIKK